MADDLSLYVWEDVLRDYTAGMVAVYAESEGDAWDELYEEDSTAWWMLQNSAHPPVSFDGHGTKSERLKAHLELEGKHAVDEATDPVEVTAPEAFVVWGGG
ncbi:hypothetical protein AFNJKBDN_CDS0012 [Halorubrum virus V_ICIS4]|nr:hypothetical protein AFNJKBDN_CDS0012 [Halorubrum virus V_ICIS4]